MPDFILITLLLICIGIAIVLLINSIKRKNEKKKVLKFETLNQKEEKTENYMTLGISLGVIFGAAIGSIFTNRFGQNSISYGICFGMLVGMLIGMTIKKK